MYVRVTPELRARLYDLAQKQGRTLSNLMEFTARQLVAEDAKRSAEDPSSVGPA